MYEVMCIDKDGNSIDHLTQWDYNQSFIVNGEGLDLSNITEVHFYNKNSKNSIAVAASLSNGNLISFIPNSLLTEAYTIYAHLWETEEIENSDSIQDVESSENSRGRAKYAVILPVKARPQPIDYIYHEDSAVVRITSEISAFMVEFDSFYNRDYNDKVARIITLEGNVSEMQDDIASINNNIDSLETNIDNIDDKIGSLDNLQTTDKTNVISAINEVKGSASNNADKIGILSSLQTVDKSSLVAALNELKTKMIQDEGTVTALQTLIGALDDVIFDGVDYSEDKSVVDLIKAIAAAAGTQLVYDEGKLYLLNHNNDELGEGITVAAQGGGLSGVKIEVLTGDALMEMGVEDELSPESYYVVIENEENSEVLSYAYLPATGGGGGGGSSTNIVITYDNQQSAYTYALGTAIRLGGSYSATDSAGDNVVCSYVWKVNGVAVMQGSAMESISSFDFTNYCTSASTYRISLTLSDGEGAVASKTWTVQTVDLRIESGFDDGILYEAGQNIRFTYTPYGAVVKTAHFILDGTELQSVTLTARQSGGSPREYVIEGQTHGAHLLECYITADIGGTVIETTHIKKNIVCYDINTSSPIITSLYQTDYVESVSLRQYNQLDIGFTVYDPATNTPTVKMTDTYTVTITDEFGETTEETRTDEVYEARMPEDSASGVIYYKTQYVGEHTLTLSCKNVSITIMLDVEDLGYDIAPVTDGIAFDFNPVGLTNSSANRLWKDSKNPDIGITVSSNFDWNGGGYKTDSEGNQYFCVKAGTTATLSYNLFGTDPKTLGSAFKLIFRVANVSKADANFLSCLTTEGVSGAEYNIGLEMNAHEAYIYSNAGSLYAPYAEDEIIEFDYSVNPLDGNDTSYIMTYEDGVASRPKEYRSSNRLHQSTPVPITIGSEYCDIHIYRMKAYNKALSDRDVLQNFIADARDAETMVDRYERNQIYADDNNSILTPESLAKACPDLKVLKIEAPYFTNKKSDFVPNTSVQCIHVNGDAVLDNWQFRNVYHSGQGTTSDGYGNAGRNIDIIAGFDGEHQVTSKIALDPNYITELTLGDGTVLTGADAKVSLTRTSVPNTWFNIKVNIASSENVNNAYLQKRYNDYISYESVGHKRDARIKNDMEFVNCVIFIKETSPDLTTHREFNDNDWHFYAIGNMGDSKKTDITRANDPDDLNEFVIEISDNTLPNSNFTTGIKSDGTLATQADVEAGYAMKYPITKAEWEQAGNTAHNTLYNAWGDTYEFRYDLCGDTKDGIALTTDEEKEAQRTKNRKVWQDFYTWVITSSDAEFVAQLSNWFIVDSALYFYLFTHRYTMIDNRAKNTFWRWSKWYVTTAEAAEMSADKLKCYTVNDTLAAINDGYRFDMCAYDFDTAFGINNSGVLAIPYGREDGDTYDNGSYIFNAADSVFWCRIRDLMHRELQAMYTSTNSSGLDYNGNPTKVVKDCWNPETLIAEFDKYQSQFPEELWRLDIERKYYRTYWGESIDNSIPKLEARFFVNMLNGRKKYQRRQWERDQSVYMGTKYLSTDVQADVISFRCNAPQETANWHRVITPSANLTIIPYSDMYLSVMFGNSSPRQVRAKAGQSYLIETSISAGSSTTVYVYAASHIQELSDLSACYIDDNNFSAGVRLQKLVIGSNVEGYSNPMSFTALSLGAFPMLEELDVRGCTELQAITNFSKLNGLKRFYATGTSLSDAEFANNGGLETAYLPSSVQSLVLPNLYNITDFPIENLTRLESLSINNSINSATLSSFAYELTSASIDTLTSVSLSGIDWSYAGLPDAVRSEIVDLLEKLYTVNSTSITGVIDLNSIRQKFLDKYNAKWRNLTINAQRIIHQTTVTFYNADGTPIKDTNGDNYVQYIDLDAYADEIEDIYILHNPITTGEVATPTLKSTPQYTYTFKHWAVRNQDGTIADEEFDFDSVTEPTELIAVYTPHIREYTVNWYYNIPSFSDSVATANAVYIEPTALKSSVNSVSKKSGRYKYGDMAVFSGKKIYYIAQGKTIAATTATDPDGDGTTTYYTQIPTGYNEAGMDYYIEKYEDSAATGTFEHYRYVNGAFVLEDDTLYDLEDIDGNVFIGAKLPPVKYGRADTEYYIDTYYHNGTRYDYYNQYAFNESTQSYELVKNGVYRSEIGLYDIDGVTLSQSISIINSAITESLNCKEYAIFKGWDKSTGCVTPELDSNGEPIDVINVFARWEVMRISESNDGAYDKITADLSEMKPTEIYAVTASGKTSDFFVNKDYFDMRFGNDLDFDNVKSLTLVEPERPLVFDPDNDRDEFIAADSDGVVIETQSECGTLSGFYKHPVIPVDENGDTIKLFSADAPSFTMAIDYMYTNRTDIDAVTNESVMLSCYDADGNKGMKLWRSGDNSNVVWGNVDNNNAAYASRSMLVIRHIKGSDKLFIYKSGTTSSRISVAEISRSTDYATDAPLVLGGIFDSENSYQNGAVYNGTGTISFCKIWYDDLGDRNARYLAAWIHEEARFEYYDNLTGGSQSAYTYFINGKKSNRASASFVCNNALKLTHVMNVANVNTGGWIGYASDTQFIPNNMRVYQNNRLILGTPLWLKALIKKVGVPSNTGYNATSAPMTDGTYTSYSYFYSPSLIEFGGSSATPYRAEGERISWITTASYYPRRFRFSNIITNDDGFTASGGAKHTTSTDPVASKGLYDAETNPDGVKEGDIWWYNNGTGYIYVSAETIKEKGLAVIDVVVNGVKVGGWRTATTSWLRSPSTGNSYYFWNVYTAGSLYNFGGAYNSYAVVPCFSI